MGQEQAGITPAKKRQTRSCKLTKEQYQDKMQKIIKELYSNVGKKAILYVKDGREMVPYFVDLVLDGKHIIARYRNYYPNGEFRCYLNHFVNHVSLMTGDQKIVYLQDV